MPIYEYRCDQGHTFEVLQRMSDDALTSCTACEAPAQRVFAPVAVHFKGSGFYTTDYGRGRAKSSETGGEERKSSSKDSGSSSDSSDSSSSSKESKPSSSSNGSKPD